MDTSAPTSCMPRHSVASAAFAPPQQGCPPAHLQPVHDAQPLARRLHPHPAKRCWRRCGGVREGHAELDARPAVRLVKVQGACSRARAWGQQGRWGQTATQGAQVQVRCAMQVQGAAPERQHGGGRDVLRGKSRAQEALWCNVHVVRLQVFTQPISHARARTRDVAAVGRHCAQAALRGLRLLSERDRIRLAAHCVQRAAARLPLPRAGAGWALQERSSAMEHAA